MGLRHKPNGGVIYITPNRLPMFKLEVQFVKSVNLAFKK